MAEYPAALPWKISRGFVDFLDDFMQRRDALGFCDKSVIFSEFGGAALYGCHDNDNIMWSEECQAKLILQRRRIY